MAARRRASSGPRPAVRKNNVIRINENLLGRTRPAQPENPFAGTPRTLHPPGVGAPHPTQAMDDAYSAFSSYAGWSYGGLGGAVAEGQIFLGYPILAALGQRVEYVNAISSIADDMVRKWIEFKASAGVDKSDRIKALKDKFEAIKVQSEVKTHLIQALLFGRAHLYLDTGDTDKKDELKERLKKVAARRRASSGPRG